MNLNNKENNKLKIKNKELRLVLEMKKNLKKADWVRCLGRNLLKKQD